MVTFEGLSYIFMNWNSAWARYSYRTAFVAAAATYGIVVYKAFRAKARSGRSQQGGALALAGDENVQYLGLSITKPWASMSQYELTAYRTSDGIGLALLPPNPARSSSIYGLLCLSRSNIHSHQHSPYRVSTTATCSGRLTRWPSNRKSFPHGRYYWQIRQRVLRYLDDARR